MQQLHTTMDKNPTGEVAAADHSQSAGRLARLMVCLFIISMLVPVWIHVGSVKLIPHRIILLLMFVPLFFQLFTGKAGKVRIFDVLMLLSASWAVLAIAVNGNTLGDGLIQPMGIYVLESFGAYLLGRVAIRSTEDFIQFSRIFLFSLLILVPFAAAEAITHRAIMLELLPQSAAKNENPPRWGLRRAQTVFAHPILFGVFCSVGIGLFWYTLRSAATRTGGALLAFAGTFFSLSTGALISITVQVTFIAWEWMTKRFSWRWRVFAVMVAIAYIMIDLLSNRTPFHVLITYGTFNTGSAYNRILIWRFGMENVWANPWFGLGENVTMWKRPYWMSSSADNYWLLLAMQYGIPCFLGVAGALAIIIRRVALAPMRAPMAQACRAGYLTVMGGLIVAGGTAHYWHGVMAFVMFFFGAGVWMIDAGMRDNAKTPDAPDADAQPQGADPPRSAELVYTRQSARHERKGRAAPVARAKRA